MLIICGFTKNCFSGVLHLCSGFVPFVPIIGKIAFAGQQ